MEHTGDGAALRTITDLRQTKQGRIAVFFDGEFDFSVDDETLVQYHLAVGKRYTAGQYEQLRLQTQYKKARDKAFSLLSRRAYPAAQLRQKLEQKLEHLADCKTRAEALKHELEQDFPEDCVQEVLERVEELGLIDDADYALRCAKDLINIKHYSLQRVRQELRHRGIHDNDIEDAMQEFEDFDEQQAVQQLLEKKFAAALTEEKGRRRAFQALLRLGYDAGTVKSQMQRAMEQLEPEEEPEQPSDPEEEIRALLLKKYRKNLEDPKGIERAIRALMRRGYAYGDIRSVLKQLAEEE